MTVWRLASGGAMRGRMRQHHAIRLRRARASPAESAALWDDGPSSQERNSSSVRSRLRRRCGIVELNRQAGHFHRWTPLPVRPFFFIARPHTGHLFALLDGVLTPSSPPPGAHHFPRDKNDRPTRLLPQGRATVISTTKVPIGLVLERLSECGNRLLLGVADMHTLLRLLQRVGVWGDGPIFVGVVLIPVVVNELGVVIALIGVLRSHVARSAPVTGLGLVERLDRVNVCAKAFEVLDVLGHVLSEFLRVCKIIATRVVSTSGVTAVGQEPRSGVGEGLYVGDVGVIAGGTALNPPVLGGGLGEVILVVVSRVECRSQLVFVGLLGGYAIAIRAGAGGVIFPRARHGSALAHEWVAVGNIGGIAAAHVVAGHVQVQSFITEDGLVELFAQLFAVFHSLSLGSVIAEIGGDGRFLAEAAGGVGEPSQRGAPAIETVGIPRVRGHGNGIVISRIRSAGNRKRPSSH